MPEQPTGEGFGDQLGTVVSGISSPPGWWLLLITGALAVFIRVTGGWFWQANVLSTIVHEAGHAVVSFVFGGGVRYIAITSPDTGHTSGRWWMTRAAEAAHTFAGYAMPALAGLGCAALLSNGHASGVLFAGVLTLIAVLVFTRDGVSFLVVILVGGVLAAVLWWGPLWLHLGLAATIMWLLLIGEIPAVWGLVVMRWHGRESGSDDASAMREVTGLPAPVWVVAWYAGIGWCCWESFWLLWPVA